MEGLLDGVTAGLRQDQPLRRAVDAATADKIDAFIERLEQLKALREPFKIVRAPRLSLTDTCSPIVAH